MIRLFIPGKVYVTYYRLYLPFLWILALLMFSTPPAFATSGLPIRIGATVSLEGKYVEISEMIQSAYHLWVDQVNQQGGLLGRPVKLLLYNDKSQNSRAGDLYEKLIADDKVDLVLSPYGTPLTLAASEVTESHRYVMLACNASGRQIWQKGYRMVFGLYAQADRYFIGFLHLMAKYGLESLGIIFEKTPFNISVAEGAQEWSERFGLNIRYNQGFDDPEKELPVILKQVAAKGVDGLIFSGYPPECYAFIDLMKYSAYRPNALTFTIAPALPDFYEKTGGFGEGIFGPSQWEPDERIPFPGTAQFISDFQAFTGKKPAYHAGSAYSACQILEKAIKYVGTIDHEKIRSYISSLDTVTVIGRFKVDDTGKQIGHNPLLIQWQNGKKEIVYPARMQTSSPHFYDSK